MFLKKYTDEKTEMVEKMNLDELTETLGENLVMITQEIHMVREKHWLVLVKSEKTYKAGTLSEALKKAVKEHFGIIDYYVKSN